MRTIFDFNLGSRGLFPEERPVLTAVEKAIRESANRHGLAIKEEARLFGVGVLASQPIQQRAHNVVERAVQGLQAGAVQPPLSGVEEAILDVQRRTSGRLY